MQVKKFEAPTMQEALKVIKRELGPDAIILSTKQNRAGFGLMSKTSVEVTVAIADKDLKKKAAAEKHLPQEVKEKIWNKPAEKQKEIYDDYFERQLRQGAGEKVELRSKQAAARAKAQATVQQASAQAPRVTAAPVAAAPSASISAAGGASLEGISRANSGKRYIDIGDDEPVAAAVAPAAGKRDSDKVKNLEQDVESLKSIIHELSTARARGERDESDRGGLTEELFHAMQDLVASGVEKKFARQLVRQASFEMAPQEQSDEAAIQERLAAALLEEIKIGDALADVGARAGKSTASLIAVVGPTGVGKTTTLAKIASVAIQDKHLRVGLINLDSYKVAAADQLSTYAKIMNLPFRSVSTAEELQQAIYDFSSLDLVLIDTTGRSQKDQESLQQLKQMLARIPNLESILMVSATTRDADLNDVVNRFSIFQPKGLVFSKLDETGVYGSIYNTQKRTGLPLFYFTVGQRVPEDIEKAVKERVVGLILDL